MSTEHIKFVELFLIIFIFKITENSVPQIP